MLLEKLHLENIRSYENESIVFPEGSTLLSGDIGSGKSSILLAVEFALFGASRSSLSADALLRKGTTAASVELHLQLSGKQVVIKRSLKKEKNGIKQTPGSVSINGIKKELTPIELKAELINLLGYPEELITKDKNYLFRYTVYCPQEEMKLILQENAESRLNILRKIFNIDKYRVIRDNLGLYLKEQRKELAVQEARLEPITEFQEKIGSLQKELSALEEILAKIKPKKLQATQDLSMLKAQILEIEAKEKQTKELKEKIFKQKTLVENLEKENIRLLEKETKLKRAQEHFLLGQDLNKEKVVQEISELRLSKEKFLREKDLLEIKVKQLREKISFLQQESEKINLSEGELLEKQRVVKELEELITKKETTQERREKLLASEKTLLEKKNKDTTLLEQSKDLLERISTLSDCPTCLQEVSLDHKHEISEKEERETQILKVRLSETQKVLDDLTSRKNAEEEVLEEIISAEKKIAVLQLELKTAQRERQKLAELREEMQGYVKENNRLMLELQEMGQQEKIQEERVNKRLEQLERLKEQLVLKESQEQLLKDILEEKEQNQRKIIALKLDQKSAEIELSKLSGKFEHYERLKQQYEEKALEEKNLAVELSKQTASYTYIEKEKKNYVEKLDKLLLAKNQFIKRKESYTWLNDFFMPLTNTIEKELLFRIYHYFNELFEEWFSLLVEDSQISARLDDAFTPIVEQNGHEIAFQHLSGGERTAVSLAYRLALNKVINDVIHHIKTKDVLILDEPTDGFSSEQLEKMHDLFDKLSLRQVVLVSHEAKVESFVDRVIRIEKQEHSSRVI